MVTKKEVKKLLTINEFLEAYPNLKKSWLRRKIFLKQIPHLKIGGLIRFDLNEISKWLDDNRVEIQRGE